MHASPAKSNTKPTFDLLQTSKLQTIHFDRHHQGALSFIINIYFYLAVILYRYIANNSKVTGSENYSFTRSILYQTNLAWLFEKITRQLINNWLIRRNWKSNQTFISDLFFLLWYQMLQGLKLIWWLMDSLN